MSEGKRPGGLTALAIINILWGALSALAGFGMLAVPALMKKAAEAGDAEAKEASEKMRQALEDMGSLWHVLVALTLVSAVLLVASGIGYLQQKKFLGRKLGNVWAVLSIASSAVAGAKMADSIGGGFNFGTIIGLVYPVLTLILINGTFKEDFTPVMAPK